MNNEKPSGNVSNPMQLEIEPLFNRMGVANVLADHKHEG
jgi:hypothetical protein